MNKVILVLFSFKSDNFEFRKMDNTAFIQGETIEYLLSEKQLLLWQWAQSLPNKEFSRKDAIEATGFPARTVESIIKKLFEMKKLIRIGQGRSVRYKISNS